MEKLPHTDFPFNDLAKDVVPPAGLLERAEKKLFDRISSAAQAQPWELYLKRDEIGVNFDKIEERIASAAKPQKPVVSFPFLFTSTALALVKSKAASFTALAALLFALSAAGWHYWSSHDAPIATLVYVSDHGVAAGTTTVRESQMVRTTAGRRAVLSNIRGTIIVENGASITVGTARQNRMEYIIDFAEQSTGPAARAVFAVTPKKDGQTFSVATKDYAINVVGTVFRISPERSGHIATDVLEGTVVIEGKGISRARVCAPGRFAFVENQGRYALGKPDTAHEAGVQPPIPPASQGPAKGAVVPRPERKAALPQPQRRDSLLEAAARFEASDWRKAVDEYELVLARRGASNYEREIALFSIARLRADHDTSAAAARIAFDAYLKAFPKGSFAGESYLRLADLEYRNNPDKSLSWYEKYLSEFPSTQNTAAAEYKAGLIYLQRKNHGRAVDLLSSALKHAKNYPPDQVAAIQRTLENAKNPHGDSSMNNSGK
jgi:outer membrane protein assembly factor BamD (BamD/ComL family)